MRVTNHSGEHVERRYVAPIEWHSRLNFQSGASRQPLFPTKVTPRAACPPYMDALPSQACRHYVLLVVLCPHPTRPQRPARTGLKPTSVLSQMTQVQEGGCKYTICSDKIVRNFSIEKPIIRMRNVAPDYRH